MGRRDWNLMVLAAADGDPLSPVQLQKSLFLLGKNLPNSIIGDEFYDFQPYNYGPFDASVYFDASWLTERGFATRSESNAKWSAYAASREGLDRARQLEASLSKDVAAYVRETVAWVRSQSFPSLVRTIYRLYPEMKINSVFND